MIKRLLLAVVLSYFTAHWYGTHAVRIEWSQPADVTLTCLYHNRVLVQCYQSLPQGNYYTTIGNKGALDASQFPQATDVYTLSFDDQPKQNTTLRGVLLLPMIVN